MRVAQGDRVSTELPKAEVITDSGAGSRSGAEPNGNAGPPLVALVGVTKRFGPTVTALNSVTARIEGRIIGLLGPNGAGKSTLLKSLLGLIPHEGKASVLGMSTQTEGREIRDRVGYMPEQEAFLAGMSAVELCTYAAELSGLPRTEAMQRAHAALYYAGLEEKRYQPIDGYSTGMKQRVKLCQALVHDPAFVFLDEPTAGLDPAGREEMLALIRKTHREVGISVLFSSHLMADIERTCDRIVVLRGGRLVHAGEVSHFTQETESVFLEVDGNRDALVAARERRGVVVTHEGSGLTIEGREDSVYDHVRDALVEAEAPLRRLAPRRHALTELFEREGAHA
jgi:ABC-2 type transport system ATP-binding protein